MELPQLCLAALLLSKKCLQVVVLHDVGIIEAQVIEVFLGVAQVCSALAWPIVDTRALDALAVLAPPATLPRLLACGQAAVAAATRSHLLPSFCILIASLVPLKGTLHYQTLGGSRMLLGFPVLLR